MSEEILDTLEGEIREIDFIISLAESDKAVEKYLLSEVIRKFEVEGLKDRQEQVFYEDKVAEVIELTRHDYDRVCRFIIKLLDTPEIADILFQHYIDQMGSKGLLAKADEIIEAVEENIEIERNCRNENCEAHTYITSRAKQELKEWIQGGCK